MNKTREIIKGVVIIVISGAWLFVFACDGDQQDSMPEQNEGVVENRDSTQSEDGSTLNSGNRANGTDSSSVPVGGTARADVADNASIYDKNDSAASSEDETKDGGIAGTDSEIAAADSGSTPGTSTDGEVAVESDSGPSSSATFPSVADLASLGPYEIVTEVCGPIGDYTCYYPNPLAQNGLKHPFITWGNGAATIPQFYTLLPHLATHGFVIIAANTPSVSGPILIGGIDWLFSENDRQESVYYQKLDTTKVASMGYSLGSVGTFEIAADPRLKTTVHISGGAFDRNGVKNLRNIAAFFCGTEADIAHANCDLDFQGATVPVFYGVFSGDHFGILLPPYADQIREAVTGWLRWQLMSDDTLESMFVGADCTMCTDSNWQVQQKGM